MLEKDTTIEVFNIRKKDFKNIPIIFNAWHWDIINNGIKDLEFLNKENLYFSNPRKYTGLNENELSDMLYKIYNNILYRKETFLFHHSSSLILMITFAVMMKYKEIVLIGFDLYDNNYYCKNHYNTILLLKKKEIDNKIKRIENITINDNNKSILKKDIYKILLTIHPDKCKIPNIDSHLLTQKLTDILNKLKI